GTHAGALRYRSAHVSGHGRGLLGDGAAASGRPADCLGGRVGDRCAGRRTVRSERPGNGLGSLVDAAALPAYPAFSVMAAESGNAAGAGYRADGSAVVEQTGR